MLTKYDRETDNWKRKKLGYGPDEPTQTVKADMVRVLTLYLICQFQALPI